MTPAIHTTPISILSRQEARRGGSRRHLAPSSRDPTPPSPEHGRDGNGEDGTDAAGKAPQNIHNGQQGRLGADDDEQPEHETGTQEEEHPQPMQPESKRAHNPFSIPDDSCWEDVNQSSDSSSEITPSRPGMPFPPVLGSSCWSTAWLRSGI